MRLAHREFGGGGREPLVILHGLLGSSRNWQGAGRALAARFRVFALDLRNHGDSPSSREMSYEAMADDVIEWLDGRGIETACLMGHSLGGGVAMRLACDRPERVRLLYVVDVAPRDYPPDSLPVPAMRDLDLADLGSRREADEGLAAAIPDVTARRFVLMNLDLHGPQGPRWRVDLDSIAENLDEIRRAPLRLDDRFDGPACFLAGGRSDFLREGDLPAVRHHFPAARVVTIEGAGHLVHFEKKSEFVAEALRCADRLDR
jgi:pimeloyl-ACP methyl ester carboxylesterase